MLLSQKRNRPGAPFPAPHRARPSSAPNSHGDDGGRLTHCLSASLRDLMFGATQPGGSEAERLYRNFLNSPTRTSPAMADARERRRLGDRRKWLADAEAAMGVGSERNALAFLRERIRRGGAGGGSGEEAYADGRYMIWMVREVLMGPLMAGEDDAIEETGDDEENFGEGWVAALEDWNYAIVDLLTRTSGDEKDDTGERFFLAEEESAEDENSVDVMWRGLLCNAHLSPALLREKLERYASPQEDYENSMGDGGNRASLPAQYFHWPSFFRQAATEAADEHSKENGAGGANKRRRVNRNDFFKPRTSSVLGEEANRDWWPLLGYAVAHALLSSEHPPFSGAARVRTSRRVDHLRRDVMRSLPDTMGVGNFDSETRGSLLAGMAACVLDEVGDWTVLDGLALEQAEGRVRTPAGGGGEQCAAEEELRMNEEVCDRMRADVSQIADVLLVNGVLPKLAKLTRISLSDLVAESADVLLNYSLVHHRLRKPNPPPDEEDDPLPRLLAEDARYVVRFVETADPSLKRQLTNRKFTRDMGVATSVAPGEVPFHPMIVSVRARLLTNDTFYVSNLCRSLEDCTGIEGAIKQHCWWMLFEKMQDGGTLFEEGWNLPRSTDGIRGTATLANITGKIGISCALDYLENVVLEAKDALSSRSRTFQTPIAIKHARIAMNRHDKEDHLAEEELLCVKDAVRRTVLKLLLPRAYSPGEALRIATERSNARDPPELDHTKWGWKGAEGDAAVDVALRILAAPSMYSAWSEKLVDEEDAKVSAEEFEEDELLDAGPSEELGIRNAIAEDLAEATIAKEIELPQKESRKALPYTGNEAEKQKTDDEKDEVIDVGDSGEGVRAQEMPVKANSSTQEGSMGGQENQDGFSVEEDVEDDDEDIDRTKHLAAEAVKEELRREGEAEEQEVTYTRHYHQCPGNYSESDDYDDEDDEEAERHLAFEGDYEEEEGRGDSGGEENDEGNQRQRLVLPPRAREENELVEILSSSEEDEADALNEKVDRYIADHGGADDTMNMLTTGSGAAHGDDDGERQREREEAQILREAVHDYILPSSHSKEISKPRCLDEDEAAPEAFILHEDHEGETYELLLAEKENTTLVEKEKLAQNEAAVTKKPDSNDEKAALDGKEQKSTDTKQKGSKSIEGKEHACKGGMEFDEEEIFAAAASYTHAVGNFASEAANMNKCGDGTIEIYEGDHGHISAASSGARESGDEAEAMEQMEEAGFHGEPSASPAFNERLVDESAHLHCGERVEEGVTFGYDRAALAHGTDEMSSERERQSEQVEEEDVVDYDMHDCEEEDTAEKILTNDNVSLEATTPYCGKEKAGNMAETKKETVVDDRMSAESSFCESEDDAMEESAEEIVARDHIEILDEDEAEEGEILSDDRDTKPSNRVDDYPHASVIGSDGEVQEVDKANLYSQGEDGEVSGYGRKPAASGPHNKDEDLAQGVPPSHEQEYEATKEGKSNTRADDNEYSEGSEDASAPLTKLDDGCSAEQNGDEVAIFDLEPSPVSVPKEESQINVEAAEDEAKGNNEITENKFSADEQEPLVADVIGGHPLAEELGTGEEAKTREGRVQKEALESPTDRDKNDGSLKVHHLPKDCVSVEGEKPLVADKYYEKQKADAIEGGGPMESGYEKVQELNKPLDAKEDTIAGDAGVIAEDAPIHLSDDVEDDVNMLADDEHESIDGGATERPSVGNIHGDGVPLVAAKASFSVEQQQQQPSVLVAAAMSTQRQQLEYASRQEVTVGDNQSFDNTSAALASTDANLWENYDEASQGDGIDVGRANVQVVARYHGHDLKALGSVLDVHADADDDSAEDSSQENKKKGQMTDDGYNPDESEATEEERRPNRKKGGLTDVRPIDDGYDPDAEATEEERPESKLPKKEDRVVDSKPVIDEGYIPDASEASEVEQPEESSTIKRPAPGADTSAKRDVRFKANLTTAMGSEMRDATSLSCIKVNDDHTIPVNDLNPLASQSTIDEGYIPTDEGLTEEEKGHRRGSYANQQLAASPSLEAPPSIDEGYVPDDTLTEEERTEKNTPRRPKLRAGALTDDGYIPDADVTEEDHGEIIRQKRLKQQNDAVNEAAAVAVPSSQDDQSEMKMSSRDEEDGLLEHDDDGLAGRIANYEKENEPEASAPTEKMLDDAIDEGYMPSAVEGTEEERSEAEEDTKAIMVPTNSMTKGSFSANANQTEAHSVIIKEEETQAEEAIPSVLVATATALQQHHGASGANAFLSMQGPDENSGANSEEEIKAGEKILVESEPEPEPDEEDENIAFVKHEKDVMAVDEVPNEAIIMEQKEECVGNGASDDEESGDYSKRAANAEEEVLVTSVKCEKEEASQDDMAVEEVGSEVIIGEEKRDTDGASADKLGVASLGEEALLGSKTADTVELLAGSESDEDRENFAAAKYEKEDQDAIAKEEDGAMVKKPEDELDQDEEYLASEIGKTPDPVAALASIAPTVAPAVSHIKKEDKFTVAVPERAPAKVVAAEGADTATIDQLALTVNESQEESGKDEKLTGTVVATEEVVTDPTRNVDEAKEDPEAHKHGEKEAAIEKSGEESGKDEKLMGTVVATKEVIADQTRNVDEAKEDFEAHKRREKHAGRREAEESNDALQESATSKNGSAAPKIEEDLLTAELGAGGTKNVGEVREDFSRLKVKQLQARLRQLNLTVSGRKQELIDRLNGHLYPTDTGDDESKASSVGRPKTSRQQNLTPSSSKLASSSRSRRGKKQLEDTPISELSHPIDSDMEDDNSVQERHFSSEASNSKLNLSLRRGGKNDGPSPGVPKEVIATSKGRKNPPSMPAVPEGKVVEGVNISRTSADAESLKSEEASAMKSKRSTSRRTKKDETRKGIDDDEGVSVVNNPPQNARRRTRAASSSKRRNDDGTDKEVSNVASAGGRKSAANVKKNDNVDDVKEKKELPKKRGRLRKDINEEEQKESPKKRGHGGRQKKNLEGVEEVRTAVKEAPSMTAGTSRRTTRGTAKKTEVDEEESIASTAKRSTRRGASKRKAEEEASVGTRRSTRSRAKR